MRTRWTLSRRSQRPSVIERQSALLYHLALFNHERGWVQQFHLGALRSINSRQPGLVSPAAGFDAIGDFASNAGCSPTTVITSDGLCRTSASSTRATISGSPSGAPPYRSSRESLLIHRSKLAA
jgi:hypothetical protein